MFTTHNYQNFHLLILLSFSNLGQIPGLLKTRKRLFQRFHHKLCHLEMLSVEFTVEPEIETATRSTSLSQMI